MAGTFRLSKLPPGGSARIAALDAAGTARRRLLDLGMVPGTDIRCVGESPCGDPRAYRLRGTVIALRADESGQIALEGEPPRGETRVALSGNPNVGKSTLFNRLTGLQQHTGNWPGKTVAVAEGVCRGAERVYRLTDLPGTYSLLARSPEEEIARDFLCGGGAEAVIAVCDACSLERSLPLALQTIELHERVLVCVNLTDEAARRGLTLDLRLLEERLGVPVVGLSAHNKRSRTVLLAALDRLLDAPAPEKPYRVQYPEGAAMPWRGGESGSGEGEALCAAALYRAAEALCEGVCTPREADDARDRRLDRLLTGRWSAWPLLLLLLAFLFWLTIVGANLPSRALAALLFSLEGKLSEGLRLLGATDRLRGLLCEGAWRVLAWVVSVMLPPRAIFFPLFTLLEDAGVLPRVAYDLDRPFRRCGSCGRQSLCMMMGLGCNAAGVTGCRILSSERERLLAVLTNALTPCNGRFPLLIALTGLFWANAEGLGGSLLSALCLSGLLCLSVAASFGMTWLLSRTLLRGEPAAFILELPPYRTPRIGKVLLRSLLDRTLFVLGRAAAVAAPAGAVLWLLANGGAEGNLLGRAAAALDPAAAPFGLDGAILLGFLLGLPANEIVLPIILMVYTAAGTLSDPGSAAQFGSILAAHGWTAWTAGSVMLFCLFHWPCSTTLLTIRKETGSWKWTALAALLPTLPGLLCCLLLHALQSLVGA